MAKKKSKDWRKTRAGAGRDSVGASIDRSSSTLPPQTSALPEPLLESSFANHVIPNTGISNETLTPSKPLLYYISPRVEEETEDLVFSGTSSKLNGVTRTSQHQKDMDLLPDLIYFDDARTTEVNSGREPELETSIKGSTGDSSLEGRFVTASAANEESTTTQFNDWNGRPDIDSLYEADKRTDRYTSWSESGFSTGFGSTSRQTDSTSSYHPRSGTPQTTAPRYLCPLGTPVGKTATLCICPACQAARMMRYAPNYFPPWMRPPPESMEDPALTESRLLLLLDVGTFIWGQSELFRFLVKLIGSVFIIYVPLFFTRLPDVISAAEKGWKYFDSTFPDLCATFKLHVFATAAYHLYTAKAPHRYMHWVFLKLYALWILYYILCVLGYVRGVVAGVIWNYAGMLVGWVWSFAATTIIAGCGFIGKMLFAGLGVIEMLLGWLGNGVKGLKMLLA